MTRERQELLSDKYRQTELRLTNAEKQCLSRAPQGALAMYCFLRPLAGVVWSSCGSASFFMR